MGLPILPVVSDGWLRRFAEEPLAVLTAVLIAVTAFYAFTTYRTLRLLRADFEYRIRPVLELGTSSTHPPGGSWITLTATARHAMARIFSANGIYRALTAGAAEMEHGAIGFNLDGRFVDAGETLQQAIPLPAYVWFFLTVRVEYGDLAGHARDEAWTDHWWGTVPQDVRQTVLRRGLSPNYPYRTRLDRLLKRRRVV